MKKMLLLGAITMYFGSVYANADVSTLRFFETQAKKYYKNGSDNNFVSSALTNQTEFESKFNSIQIRDVNALETVIRQCVFMRHGAYGEHMSAKQQDFITDAFMKDIRKNKKGHRFFQVDGERLLDESVFSAPCGLAIKDEQNNVMVLQSLSFDW